MYILLHLPDELASDWFTTLHQRLAENKCRQGAIVRLPQSPELFADLRSVAIKLGTLPGVSITFVADPDRGHDQRG